MLPARSILTSSSPLLLTHGLLTAVEAGADAMNSDASLPSLPHFHPPGLGSILHTVSKDVAYLYLLNVSWTHFQAFLSNEDTDPHVSVSVS